MAGHYGLFSKALERPLAHVFLYRHRARGIILGNFLGAFGFSEEKDERLVPLKGESMRLTIAKKLWLSFGILILVLGISGSISYLQIQKLNDALRLFMVVQEPLEAALLEMEVNIGESAISVFGFVRDGNPAHIESLHHFQGIIEEDLTGFNSLATTKAEKEFGRKTNTFFLKHKALSQDIITLAGAMRHEQVHFTKLADQVNGLIDLNLSGASDKSDLSATLQREAALLMKISFHRVFAAIEGYIIQRAPLMKKEISAAEDAFLKWNRIYAGSGLPRASKTSLSELDALYHRTKASGNELVRLADQLQTRIEGFEKDLLEIKQILNDDIQPLLRRETERTAENALQSGAVALSVTLAMTLFALMATGSVTWIITRGISHSARQLKEGSKAFGQGNLGHNIEVKSDDELKEVAIAFNRMAGKTKKSGKTAPGKRRQDQAVLIFRLSRSQEPGHRHPWPGHSSAETIGTSVG